MTVNLYTNISANNVVDKNITLIDTVDVVLKDNTDIVDPVLLLNDSVEDYGSNINYIYIPQFNRYYYILGITSMRYDLLEISCHCDVLMSFKDTIREQSGIIARQENNFNKYLKDNRIKVNAKPYVYQTKFPNAFSSGYSYVLSVLGNSETATLFTNEEG